MRIYNYKTIQRWIRSIKRSMMCWKIKLSMIILMAVAINTHLVLLLLLEVGMTQLIWWLIQIKENQAYITQAQEHRKLYKKLKKTKRYRKSESRGQKYWILKSQMQCKRIRQQTFSMILRNKLIIKWQWMKLLILMFITNFRNTISRKN